MSAGSDYYLSIGATYLETYKGTDIYHNPAGGLYWSDPAGGQPTLAQQHTIIDNLTNPAVAAAYMTTNLQIPNVKPYQVLPAQAQQSLTDFLTSFYNANLSKNNRWDYIHTTISAKLAEYGFSGDVGGIELQMRGIYSDNPIPSPPILGRPVLSPNPSGPPLIQDTPPAGPGVTTPLTTGVTTPLTTGVTTPDSKSTNSNPPINLTINQPPSSGFDITKIFTKKIIVIAGTVIGVFLLILALIFRGRK